MNRGLIKRDDGLRLLTKYNVPMTPAKIEAGRVYKGEPIDPQGRFQL